MFTLSGHSEFAVIARVHTLTSHLAPFPFLSAFVRDIFRRARNRSTDRNRSSTTPITTRASPHQRAGSLSVTTHLQRVSGDLGRGYPTLFRLLPPVLSPPINSECALVGKQRARAHAKESVSENIRLELISLLEKYFFF